MRALYPMPFAALLLAPLALANPGGDRGECDRPPRPPREAVEVCEDLADGDPCSFSGRRGETVEGSCWAPETELPLACKPDEAPEHPPRR